MFYRQAASAFLLFTLSVLLTGWYLHRPTARDHALYGRLLAQSDAGDKVEKKESVTFQQSRKGIVKQVVYAKGSDRYQWSLTSNRSDLSLANRQGGSDFIEHFDGIHCMTQQPIEEKNRQVVVQRMNAKKAVFFYGQERLLAGDVTFARYLLPIDNWKEELASSTPFIQGTARQMEISFTDKAPSLKVEGWKAQFNEKGLAF
ncbi:MAG: hypothetical protein LW832_04290 [Parachlamydia sp.]|jgi:hypothetical protein|nr:hypothetical protein [Parachlamydia sp.]